MSYFAITSNHPRHVKYLETLYDQVELSTVVIVDKGVLTEAEADYFKSDMTLLGRDNVIRCSKQQLHSDFMLQSLHKISAKVGFIFGAPLLEKELFEIPSVPTRGIISDQVAQKIELPADPNLANAPSSQIIAQTKKPITLTELERSPIFSLLRNRGLA